MIDFVEKSTTAWRPEGAWITHLHIVGGDATKGATRVERQAAGAGGGLSLSSAVSRLSSLFSRLFSRLSALLSTDVEATSVSSLSSSLSVVDMGRAGACGTACRTIEYAARRVMGEYDGDVGEALYVGRYGDVGAFREWLCGGLTGACVGGVGGGGGGGGAAVGCRWEKANAGDVETIESDVSQGLSIIVAYHGGRGRASGWMANGGSFRGRVIGFGCTKRGLSLDAWGDRIRLVGGSTYVPGYCVPARARVREIKLEEGESEVKVRTALPTAPALANDSTNASVEDPCR